MKLSLVVHLIADDRVESSFFDFLKALCRVKRDKVRNLSSYSAKILRIELFHTSIDKSLKTEDARHEGNIQVAQKPSNIRRGLHLRATLMP